MMRTEYKTVNSADTSHVEIDCFHTKTIANWLNNYAIPPEIRIESGDISSQPINIFIVIDTFPSRLETNNAILELKRQGLSSSQIIVFTRNHQERDYSINWEYLATDGSLLAVLIGLGIDRSDASRFEQSVNNGRFLVAAIVSDRSASQAQYLLENIGRKVISVY